MVWVTGPTPSVLSERVQARGRDPSIELALVREVVLERARRVILAEGTVGEKIIQHCIVGEQVLLVDTLRCWENMLM